MGAGIVVFACVVLYGNAIAAPTEYAVDGLARISHTTDGLGKG
jgi:hypothetical protein